MGLTNRLVKLILPIIAIGFLFGCMGSKSDYELTMGTAGESGIEKEVNTFTLDQEVAFELSGDKVIGSTVNIIWIKHNDDGTEEILVNYDEPIDPTWSWLFYAFDNPGEVGEYTFRVFNEEDVLLGEGDFTVTE